MEGGSQRTKWDHICDVRERKWVRPAEEIEYYSILGGEHSHLWLESEDGLLQSG